MENAKKNLVFHFGVGRQASSFQIGYVKFCEKVKRLKKLINAAKIDLLYILYF